MHDHERGAALLEVLAAVVILTVAGMSVIEILGESTRQLAVAMEREIATAEAARILAAVTLLDRDDLDRRLGNRVIAGYIVNVQRPEPNLYRIAVHRSPGDSTTIPPPELLVTVARRSSEERRP